MNSDLQQWVARLGQEKLPGFAVTAKRLVEATGDDSSAKKIADIILPDAAMTVGVLKLANSAYYNPTKRKIDTLNYACVVLGVKAVRNLAITAASLGAHNHMEFGFQFQRELAFSFHAAMQAQTLARLQGLQQEENIYVAALLARLGHWIFWCFPYGYGEAMASHLVGQEDSSIVERELLGFSLDELTLALLQEWKLMGLQDLLPVEQPFTDAQQCVHEAFLLAAQIRKGWKHKGYQDAAKRLINLCRLPRLDLQTAIVTCVNEVRKTLKQVGIDARFWPPLEDEDPQQVQDETVPLLQQALARDLQVQRQNRYLRQLTHMLCHKVDVARFLHGVTEGLSKGIGFNNTFVLLPNPKKHQWRLACSTGEGATDMAKGVMALMDAEQDCLAGELNAGRICWPPINCRIEGQYVHLFGSDNFCVFPLRLGLKNVGYVGATKAVDCTISDEDFEVFCHFCDHALLAIRVLLIDSRR